MRVKKIFPCEKPNLELEITIGTVTNTMRVQILNNKIKDGYATFSLNFAENCENASDFIRERVSRAVHDEIMEWNDEVLNA